MPRHRDQTIRKGELRHAAGRAIVDRGGGRVRLKDIADAAGMSPSTVLYYYPDVDQLIEEAIRHAIERFSDRRQSYAETHEDPRRALVATIRAGFPTGTDDHDLRILYESAAYFRDRESLGSLIRSLTQRQVDLYQRILEVGEARGVFVLATTSRTIARNIVALEDGYGLYIIGGADILQEAPRLVLSYVAQAVGCDLALDDTTSHPSLDPLPQVGRGLGTPPRPSS